jgi:HSP20 family protein
MSTTWNPITEIESMRDQLDRLFNQVWRPSQPTIVLPPVEVYTARDRQQVVVHAELPGIDVERVSVEIAEDTVYLTGELKRAEEVRDEEYFRAERQYGRFGRAIGLPHRIKPDEARASFRNGVLTIKAPLAEELKRPPARRLTVEH